MSKRSSFRGPIGKQHGTRAQARFKSASHHLYHIHRSLSSQLSWENSVFLICQLLGLVVKTLAANEKFPVPNKENLTVPIQMQLSQKY